MPTIDKDMSDFHAPKSDFDKVLWRIHAIRKLQDSESKSKMKRYAEGARVIGEQHPQPSEHIKIKSWNTDIVSFYCELCEGHHETEMEIFSVDASNNLVITLGAKVSCPDLPSSNRFFIVTSPYINEDVKGHLDRKTGVLP